MAIIFILQIIFLTFLGPAIRVVKWGLDPIGWLISIAIGSLTLICAFVLKFIPLERCLPGGGKEELKVEDLKKMNSLAVRKFHSREFYQNRSSIHKKSLSKINGLEKVADNLK